MGRLRQDLRFGLRQLRRNPGFTLVALLTLALGIGANAAMFSVLDGVVLAPLPYREPDRLALVLLYNSTLKTPTYLSYLDFLDWRRQAKSFEQMAVFASHAYDLTGPGTPQHVGGREVSSGFFSTLGVLLPLGREFSAEEDRQGGAPTVIISQQLWRDRFGSASSALGKSVTLSGRDYTIVGVLPAGFQFGNMPEDVDVYTPIGQGSPMNRNVRTSHDIACLARVNAGVGIAQAQAEMNTIQENLDRLYPAAEKGLETAVLPLKQQLLGEISGTLFWLLGAVGIVLLIACANVANLLLARSASRAREFAVRSALGASRANLVCQLLTESVLLSLAGGVAGIAVAKWGLSALHATLLSNLPSGSKVGLNTSVLFFTLGVSVLVGILFGLVPALKRPAASLQGSLRQGERGSTGIDRHAQSALSVAQMALTVVLLVAAGLLLRTIQHLWKANPGFETQHIVAFKVGLSPSAIQTPSAMRTAYQQLIERIRQLPGVQSADLTTLVPLTPDDNWIPFWIGNQKPQSVAEAPRARLSSTGPEYFKVMGIPLLQGRSFDGNDSATSPLVILIDNKLARSYFPGKNPVGQIITFPNAGDYRIIGVVGHVQHRSFGTPGPDIPVGEIYSSFYQIQDQWMPVMQPSATVVVRTRLDAGALIPAVKTTVFQTGNEQPIYDVQTIEQIVSGSMSSQRLPMLLLGLFAGLALALASVGVYGVVSYSVTRRIQEIGIRVALGAEKQRIFRMIMGDGLRLASVGLLVGAVGAIVVTRVLSSFSHLLFGVGAGDPLTFALVSAMLIGVTAVACYVPAHRATAVDPMVALRHE